MENVYNKSTSGEIVRARRKRKNMKNSTFKKIAAGLIALALLVSPKVIDKIERDRKLDAANEYMRTKIVSYLEKSGSEYSVLDDVILLENDQEKLSDFVDSLRDEGFSLHEVFYMVSQVCDIKDFDNIVKVYGYKDSQDFLNQHYQKGEASNEGTTFLTRGGSERVFENMIESEYVESVKDLMEAEENKGLNR